MESIGLSRLSMDSNLFKCVILVTLDGFFSCYVNQIFMKVKLLTGLILSIFIACGSSEDPAVEYISSDTQQVIINDMRLDHEAVPHGIPDTYNWKYKPRVGYGNNCPGEWNSFITWGQVYVDETQDNAENPAPNTRVEIKNMRALLLTKAGKWVVLQDAQKINGANYAEDFVDDANKPADIWRLGDGSISITAGQGYNFHFFPDARVTVSPDNIKGIVVMMSARLVLNNPTGEDDRARSTYLLSAGADYWRSPTANWSADWSNNGDVGIGRFKRVTPEWLTYYMHSLPAADFNSYPIPLELIK